MKQEISSQSVKQYDGSMQSRHKVEQDGHKWLETSATTEVTWWEPTVQVRPHSALPHSSPGEPRTSLVAEQRIVPLRQVAALCRHQTAGPVCTQTDRQSLMQANTDTYRQKDRQTDRHIHTQLNAENADTWIHTVTAELLRSLKF